MLEKWPIKDLEHEPERNQELLVMLEKWRTQDEAKAEEKEQRRVKFFHCNSDA